jgi:hypothetical protein
MRINDAGSPIWWRPLSNSRQWIAAALPPSRRMGRIPRKAHKMRYPTSDSHLVIRCRRAALKRNGVLLNSSPTVKSVKPARSPRALLLAG